MNQDSHKSLNLFLWSVLALTLHIQTVQGALSDGSNASDYKGIFAIGSVWSFVSVFDFDTRRVTPAIIDIGMTHGQTRPPGNACMINYQVGPLYDISCNSPLGPYEGIMNQTQPGSSSPYRFHGTRMKNRIAATLNDNGDDVGIAGQVAVPNLYQMQDVHGFLFELNTAITRAVDDDSSVINISAGLPCQLLWNTEFSPDICTLAGRVAYCATPFTHGPPTALGNSGSLDSSGFTDFLLSLTPVMKSLLCTAAGVAVVEGDLRQNMLQATLYAQQHGVPIVASAGNLWGPITLNPQTNETLDLTPEHLADVSDWAIIPATLSGVIAVGAVNREDYEHPTGHPNADFHGDRVDIWAPAEDTSPAAAFVSGVITVAQAVNPTLDPTNQALSADLRKGITDRVRSMLQTTAFTSAHPQVAADTYRRNLINPYGFIREAAKDRVPAFESLGYAPVTDDLLTDNGEIHPEDHDFWRMPLGTTQVARAGSIVYVPGSTPYVDTDEFQLIYPSESGPFAATLDLYYLQGYGDLNLTSGGRELTLVETRNAGVETRRRYRVTDRPAGERLQVTVGGIRETDDNLYRLVAKIKDQYDGPTRVEPDAGAEAADIQRFLENMRTAFRGGLPPEAGCVTCNSLSQEGSLVVSRNRHAVGKESRFPANTRTVRFVSVDSSGKYSLTVDPHGARAIRGLSLRIYDERGRQVASTGRNPNTLTTSLKPGNYIVVVAGDIPAKRDVTLGYNFRAEPANKSRAKHP